MLTAERRGPAETSEDLRRTWSRGRGLTGWLGAVGHKQVGKRFVVTALAFFLVGGVEALLLRTQLARPQNDFLGPDAYNELFTMHGSTMMFLFAVPFMEGVANYLLPMMVGTRDLSFPRLNAFNYWTYLFGGLLLYSSFLVGEVPEAGWFAYPPLSGSEYLPGMGLDFWLIGVTLAEVSAIGAGIELVVVILKQRAPGMSVNRLPLFVWAMLVTAVAIVFAFTALLTGSVLLELDRKLGTHFYDPDLGGDPVLWQHLFWIFGHPEVYIMFLPATGIVSHVVQAFARREIAGYAIVALSIVATAFLSFGLWVHHMFTVGIPLITLGLFAAASYMIAIPSGVQVFAWITTIWRSRPLLRTPMLFVLAFLVVFVLGGITGVMVATVPFDWQAHDSYFLVAHFHYVLIGGVVFPAFAGLYYWLPKATGRWFHRRLSLWSFWLVFIGFNVTFFPMHLSGLFGMPRRVYTYGPGQGLDELNLASTVGAFVLAVGFLLSILSFAASRWGAPAGDNPWDAEGLEWATSSPPAPENFARIPLVSSRTPLWDDGTPRPERHLEVVEAFADRPTGWRAALGTTPTDAEPSEVVYIAGPTLWPLATAAGLLVTAVGALTGAVPLVLLGAVAGLAGAGGWIRDSERQRHAATAGFEVAGLPVDVLGSQAIGWWGLVLFLGVLVSVLGSLLFSYFFLRVRAEQWPPPGSQLPTVGLALAVTGLLTALAVTAAVARARARAGARPTAALSVAMLLAASVAALLVVEYLHQDLRADVNAYGSLFFVLLAALGAMVIIGLALTALAAAVSSGPGTQMRLRLLASNATLYWWFTLLAWGAAFVTLYLSPRML